MNEPFSAAFARRSRLAVTVAMSRTVRSSSVRAAFALGVLAAMASACEREAAPPCQVEARAPESLEIEGEVWNRTSIETATDQRLGRLFHDRKELAGNPDFAAAVLAYEAPARDRVRFYWVRTSSAGDSWTWIETDSKGMFRSQGEAAADAFPGDG